MDQTDFNADKHTDQYLYADEYINTDQHIHTYFYAFQHTYANSDIHTIEYTDADGDIYAFKYTDANVNTYANSYPASGFTSQSCLHPFNAGQFAIDCYRSRGHHCKMASAQMESEKTFRSHQNFL